MDAYIHDLIGQDNSLTLGYCDGDHIVALAMGHIKHWFAGTEYNIDEFCVDRKMQGKGIGSMFLGEIERFLSGHGIPVSSCKRIEICPRMYFINTEASGRWKSTFLL